MPKQAYEVHPAAKLFPMMSGSEFAALKQSIKDNGQREDITIWCNQLLDGRNRWKACEELGIEPECCELDESVDPLQYVLDHNLHRRHLNATQLATVAADLATMKRGDNQHTKDGPIGTTSISTKEAAAIMNTSERSTKRAKSVKQTAAPEVVEAMREGKVTLNAAEQLVKNIPDKKEQAKAVKEGKIKEVVNKAKQEQAAEPVPTDKLRGPELEGVDATAFKAFGKAKDRLNVLFHIFKTLKPHEKIVLAEWIAKNKEPTA